MYDANIKDDNMTIFLANNPIEITQSVWIVNTVLQRHVLAPLNSSKMRKRTYEVLLLVQTKYFFM